MSNRYVHATPQSIGRYRDSAASAGARPAQRFAVVSEFPTEAIIHAVLPVIGALASCLANILDQPTGCFDQWLREANTVDGYDWSGSLARMAAVEGLAELTHLPNVDALNVVGITVRFLATTDAMRVAAPGEQLLVASEVIDRTRTALPKRLKHRRLHVLQAPHVLIGRRSPNPADRSELLSQGEAADDPQALLAALALVYAGLWPDDPGAVAQHLVDFDDTAPHDADALNRILSTRPPIALRTLRARWRQQVSKMN